MDLFFSQDGQDHSHTLLYMMISRRYCKNQKNVDTRSYDYKYATVWVYMY